MPKQQITRTRKTRKSRGNNRASVAPAIWAPGSSGTELKWYYGLQGNYQLYHNNPVNYFNLGNLLDSIITGTSQSQRVGNRIFLKDATFSLTCNNKSDRPNVTYRFVVCAAPAAFNTDAFSELFAAGVFSSPHIPTNSMLLHDAIFPVNQGATMYTSTKERTSSHTVSLRINKPVVYNSDGTATTRLVAFLVAYDSFGTLVTDNIASLATTSWILTYTDA